MRYWIALSLVLYGLAAVATADLKKGAPITESDLVSYTNAVYRNHDFGISIKIPKDWKALARTKRDELNATSREVLTRTTDDKELKKEFAKKKRNTTFLTMYYGGKDALKGVATMLAAWTEQLPENTTVTDPRQYLANLRKILTSGRLPYTYAPERFSMKVDGKTLYFQIAQVQTGKQTIFQEQYALLKEGHAIGFVLTYQTPQEGTRVRSVLQGMTFDKQ